MLLFMSALGISTRKSLYDCAMILISTFSLLRQLLKANTCCKRYSIIQNSLFSCKHLTHGTKIVQCEVSTAGPALIHSSVKLKLAQLHSKCWFCLLQRVSHKTRLCGLITAACTGARAFSSSATSGLKLALATLFRGWTLQSAHF